MTKHACAACAAELTNTAKRRMAAPWTARARRVRQGSQSQRTYTDNDIGPHAAGTFTCPACDPRRT